MKVIISAGGTGGHIYPALAIINKIKDIEPNSSFLYIGTTDRMEKDIIPELGIPYVSSNLWMSNGVDEAFRFIRSYFNFID